MTPTQRIVMASLLAAAACAPMIQPELGDARPGRYVGDPTHVSAVFRLARPGATPLTGRFDAIDAALDFDPLRPDQSQVRAVIDPASLSTGSAAQSDELARAGLFADDAPIVFESRRVRLTGPQTAQVSGPLTWNGAVHDVTFAVRFNGSLTHIVPPLTGRRAVGFSGSTQVRPSRWGAFATSDRVADQIAVAIEAEFLAAR
ncbi:MAG: YceI family protein [Maricaulaceae bacterium]